MTGSNPLLTARFLAKYFIDVIGRTNAYTEENTIRVDALRCERLLEKPLTKLLADQLKAIHPGLVIHVVTDKEMNGPIYGASFFDKKKRILTIFLNPRLNYCWRKFTLVKELCHVYCIYTSDAIEGVNFREDGDFRKSLENVFKETENFREWDASAFANYDYIEEELFVILLAIELMIPVYDRERIASLVSQIGQNPLKITTSDVAKSILMPELLLKKYIDLKLFETPPFYKDFPN